MGRILISQKRSAGGGLSKGAIGKKKRKL